MTLLVFISSIGAIIALLLEAGLTWLESRDGGWARTVARLRDEESRDHNLTRE